MFPTSDHIAAILKSKRKELNLTAKAVADELRTYGIDISDKTLYGWESGHRQPDADIFLVLCRIYGIKSFSDVTSPPVTSLAAEYSPEERSHIKKYRVLDVHGRRIVDSVLSEEYDRMTHVVERDQTGATTYINCYDLAVSAGPGEPWVNDACVTQLKISTERVPENAHYCARVNGNSMEPAYKDGDIVFVQRQDELVREGEIGIFALNGEGYIKRLGHQELISLNPEYAPIPIREYDDLRCQGRVLGKV